VGNLNFEDWRGLLPIACAELAGLERGVEILLMIPTMGVALAPVTPFPSQAPETESNSQLIKQVARLINERCESGFVGEFKSGCGDPQQVAEI